ncbi:hypothetical protein [Epilithonimonas sp.]|uniref:toxin-antitoxin system YwqK family antitoxin n=1 Tax=Epilithonimonas sp. TaxID=2894511 RepID=UPI0028A249FA|nr:hypothetical protein [Epilithonimonas sp.]
MSKFFLTFVLIFSTLIKVYAQNINLDEYEIYINNTLIAKSDFLKNSNSLTEQQFKTLEFKPITDGTKKAYFLNGKISSTGKIQNKKENGIWEYWHSNGNKAREGEFVDGKPNGTHKYWFDDGSLRAIGNWKNGVYDGEWEMYKFDGKEKVIQHYKEGKLVE